jgi:hypothetical protein
MVYVVGQTAPVGPTSFRTILAPFFIGLGVAALALGLGYLLDAYVIGRITCGVGTSVVSCESSPAFSSAIGLIIACVVSLVLLVRQRVYRPLLVMLAALAVLWGIGASWPAAMNLLGISLAVVAGGLVFSLFSWLAQIRNFIISIVCIIAVVIALRMMIML